MSAVAAEAKPIRSTIPARLDRLRWSPFHTGMVAGLVGAGIMMFGGVIEIRFGINAEGKSLEDITKPLIATAEPPEQQPVAAPA